MEVVRADLLPWNLYDTIHLITVLHKSFFSFFVLFPLLLESLFFIQIYWVISNFTGFSKVYLKFHFQKNWINKIFLIIFCQVTCLGFVTHSFEKLLKRGVLELWGGLTVLIELVSKFSHHNTLNSDSKFGDYGIVLFCLYTEWLS